MAKVKVKLTHNCHKKGCEGLIDEVIDVEAADAKFLEERGGAFRCDEDGNRLKEKDDAKAEK